jgi:hypothetical protein
LQTIAIGLRVRCAPSITRPDYQVILHIARAGHVSSSFAFSSLDGGLLGCKS